MLNAKEIEQINKLSQWTDVSWGRGKGVGYIQVWNSDYQTFLENIGRDELYKLKRYKGSSDVYMTINAYDSSGIRRKEYLKQYRAIVVDLDIYNNGIGSEAAYKVIRDRVQQGKIPEPSMITYSNGIHLYYSIYDGAAVNIRTTNMYNAVRKKLLNELKDLNSDSVATALNNIIRMPESINSRTGNKNIVVELNYEYELKELYLWAYEPELPKASDKNRFFGKNSLAKRARERLIDLRALLVSRAERGYTKGYRNNLTYIYAYHSAILKETNNEVQNDTLSAFNNANITPDSKFERTVRQAFVDAKEFLEQYQKDNMRIVFRENDNIKKPHKTMTIIDYLDIKEDEYADLQYLVEDEVRKKRHYEIRLKQKEQQRREKGIRSMKDYNADRKRQTLAKRTEAFELLQKGYTKKEIAKELEAGYSTVKRWLKGI